MNQCIINIVGQMVFITFNQIIEKGSIEIWSLKNPELSLKKTHMKKTNFESVILPSEKGGFRIEVKMDGKRVIKMIHIK